VNIVAVTSMFGVREGQHFEIRKNLSHKTGKKSIVLAVFHCSCDAILDLPENNFNDQ
jgi:hypothetical protein